MRSLLMNADLPSKFWSYALTQAVFIKNRIPHSFHDFKKTPFEMLTGRRPDISGLKVFGSRIVAKNPGKRSMKLDDHTSRGVFLHHTSTTAISKFLDDATGREKTLSHIVYDEAHYTQDNKPAGARTLINNGYTNTMTTCANPQEGDDGEISKPVQQLTVKKLSEDAIIPTRATEGSAGLDIYDAQPTSIAPGEIKLIPTDIAIECPRHSYGRIAPKSGITIKRKLDVRAGVIDADYQGNVIVTMHNIGDKTQVLEKGTKIAQLIIEQIVDVHIEESQEMSLTDRNDKGFGSTDDNTATIPIEYEQHEVIIVECLMHFCSLN